MAASLPPGSPGLAFIGETLSLVSDPYAFLASRRARFGPVFRSRVLGREVVFLSGPEGMAAFLDPEKVTRSGGHMAHVRALFGGTNINMYDGPHHAALKQILLDAFAPDALRGYLPQMDALVGATLGRCAQGGVARMEGELRRLAVDVIALNVLGIEPGPEAQALLRDYEALPPGFLATPIAFPGTPFAAALQARDRLLERFRALVADRRAQPRQDGLSRAMAAVASDGTRITDEELVLELNHIVVAGYIVYALLAELLLQLSRQPALLAAARAEVAAVTPAGSPSLEELARLELLARIVMEAKRTAPIVPFIFGVARTRFEVGGFEIPEGWGVQMAIPLSNQDATVFAEPERFDPARYAEPRCEHARRAHGWIPQGSGPPTGHRCLGVEYSTLLAQVFLVRLLRGYDWSFPPQDLGYAWNVIPAGFKDGLQVQFSVRGR